MEDEHKDLDIEYDRTLIRDVLDSPNMRYCALYMYALRKYLFDDFLDDTMIEEFNEFSKINAPLKMDVDRIFSRSFVKKLIEYNVFKNVYDNGVFQSKMDDFRVNIDKGIKLLNDEVSADEDEVDMYCTIEYLERYIRNRIPELNRVKILEALKRMRAMMCPKSTAVHELVHNYGDYYVLNDEFYYIIDELGNPFQALRLELMIRAMADKYKEIENDINTQLQIFDKSLSDIKFIKKLLKITGVDDEDDDETGTGAGKRKGSQGKGKDDGGKDIMVVKRGQKITMEDIQKYKSDKNITEEKYIGLQSLDNLFEEYSSQDSDSPIDYLKQLQKHTRKGTLPFKFEIYSSKKDEEDEEDEDQPERPELYIRWKEVLNELLKFKVQFTQLNRKMKVLQAFYSGKSQIMSYMDFIEKITYDEDSIGEKITKLLIDARNSLKNIGVSSGKYDNKELRLLNLDLERFIIEEGLEEED